MSEPTFKPSRDWSGGVIVTAVVPVEVPLSVRSMAESFCALSADEQAEFFSRVDEVMKSWRDGAGGPMQRYGIAQALKGEGMDGGRSWIRDLVDDLEAPK